MRHKIEPVSTERECQSSAVLPSWYGGDLTIGGIVDAITAVGRKRKALLDLMRGALETGDNERALNFARQLCGLSNEEEKPRTHTRVN
jgi:hypothetical protein